MGLDFFDLSWCVGGGGLNVQRLEAGGGNICMTKYVPIYVRTIQQVWIVSILVGVVILSQAKMGI